MCKNNEGYPDPTAAAAIREADKPPENVVKAVRIMKFAADCLGCDLAGRIRLRDRATGREYW